MHAASKLHSAISARVHDVRPHCRLMSHFKRTPANSLTNFILPETRVLELHEGCYSIGPSIFTFTQQFSKPKKRCSKRALKPKVHYAILFARASEQVSDRFAGVCDHVVIVLAGSRQVRDRFAVSDVLARWT